MVKVNQYGAIAPPFEKGKVVDPEMLGRCHLRLASLPHEAEQGSAAGWLIHLCGEACTSSTAEGETETLLPLAEAARAPSPRSHDRRKAFSKDAAGAAGGGTKPLAGREPDTNTILCPWKIGEGPQIVAMDMRGGDVTGRTESVGLHGANGDGHLPAIWVKLDRCERKSSGIGQEQRNQCRKSTYHIR